MRTATAGMSKTLHSQLIKRAARNDVLVWDDGRGGWLLPSGDLVSGVKPTYPSDSVRINEMAELIRLGAQGDEHSSYSGVGVRDGYACATDRYRAYSLTGVGAAMGEAYLSAPTCRTLSVLIDTPYWGSVGLHMWDTATDAGGFVQSTDGALTLSLPFTNRGSSHVVTAVRGLFDRLDLSRYEDTLVPFPRYTDHVPYQAGLMPYGWEALPDPREYGEARKALLKTHTPRVVINGRYGAEAAAFSDGTVHVHNEGDRALYSDKDGAEVLLMPVRV